MRLIDADELMKDRVKNDPVVIAVKNASTAYDVDKVLKQLEELANEHPYRVQGDPDTYSQYNEGWGDCCDRAIDIVERGGINEV